MAGVWAENSAELAEKMAETRVDLTAACSAEKSAVQKVVRSVAAWAARKDDYLADSTVGWMAGSKVGPWERMWAALMVDSMAAPLAGPWGENLAGRSVDPKAEPMADLTAKHWVE